MCVTLFWNGAEMNESLDGESAGFYVHVGAHGTVMFSLGTTKTAPVGKADRYLVLQKSSFQEVKGNYSLN